MASVCL
jgi:hypothetical protein